jgi:hypothetical protein
MTENFLERWARLKRQSATEGEALGEPEPADAVPEASAALPVPPVEPSDLPTIDSISADSSIAEFLKAGVPEELRRLALRSAWTSDPAIRDFVGIAEGQWDFNAEGAIAGFGSLSAEEYARYTAARALLAEPDAWVPLTGDNELATEPGTVVASSAGSDTAERLITKPDTAITTPAVAPASDHSTPPQRTHGSALPK